MLVIFRNDAPKGKGFELQLDDRTAQNRQAIGARIEIRSADGRKQTREIKASGGYQSFDEPLAFFGLGDWAQVASISVRWPAGDTSEISGVTLGPGRYTLTRSSLTSN